MEKNKKKIVIFIFVILIVLAIFTVVLSLFIKDTHNGDEPINTNRTQFNKEITKLINVNEFFTVNGIINDYYVTLLTKDSEAIYKLLETDYIKNNNITTANLGNIIDLNYQNPYFTSSEIYYNSNSNITYYFVNGYLVDQNILDESFKYISSLNFMVVVNKNSSNYMIMPIKDNVDIEDYAHKYSLVEKNVKGNSYNNINVGEKILISNYINVFKSLLFLDTPRAYELLDNDTKKNYESLADFTSQIENIYDKLSTNVFSYSKKEESDEDIYYVKDDNQNSIVIYEKSVMDFKIEY